MTNAPETLGELQRDLGKALAILTDRKDDYALGQAYYDGTRSEIFASEAVRKLIQGQAEFAPISLAHIPVDIIADKVELASLTADGEAGTRLEETFAANDLEDEADDIILKALYLGDYYSITDPQEEEEGKIVPASIRVIGSSPFTTVMVYDPKDSRTQLFAAKVWPTGKDSWKAHLFYNDCTIKLVTMPGKGGTALAAIDFELDDDGEEGGERIDHPGGRILVGHLPIGSKPYGTPVHRKAWGPQDAITKISATNLSNVDAQGFTSRWALADPMAEIDDDIDDDFGENGPTTDPAAGDGIRAVTDGTSRVKATPGAINILRGIKEVGQFDPTSSENFLKNLDWYVRVMAVACGVPLFEFDLTGEQPSGEARRRAESRANNKAAKVQRQAGAFFRGIGETVLALLGATGTVTAAFQPVETATDKEGIELVALKVKNGVPITQALLEAGYAAEQVEEWFPAGRPSITPEYLAILATALQQLGQAKTLGVITSAELADMLPEILTAARPETAPAAPVAPVVELGA